MAKIIGILTGGGDCPGLNPAIKGVVYAAERLGYKCVGLAEGWKGLMECKTIKLDKNFFRFIGYWIGDGFTNNYHNTERVGIIFIHSTFH